MKWNDEAIVLDARKHGETSLILKVFSKEHGLYGGFIKGALNSKKNRGNYEVGNLVEAEWKTRVEEHLGTLKIEPKESFWHFAIDDNIKLMALKSAISLILQNIQERQPEPHLFYELLGFLRAIKTEDDTNYFLAKYILFEVAFLNQMGYGLELSKCGVTQSSENLVFLSPKTGRAISESIGNPYKDKLFKLPKFMCGNAEYNSIPGYANNTERNIKLNAEQSNEITNQEISNGLAITSYFIKKHFYENENGRKNSARELFIKYFFDKVD